MSKRPAKPIPPIPPTPTPRFEVCGDEVWLRDFPCVVVRVPAARNRVAIESAHWSLTLRHALGLSYQAKARRFDRALAWLREGETDALWWVPLAWCSLIHIERMTRETWHLSADGGVLLALNVGRKGASIVNQGGQP